MITYEQYRTGMTFKEVYWALRIEFDAHFERTGERRFITRRTILGRWHQIKAASYDAYCRYSANIDNTNLPAHSFGD